uniref:Transcription initiation factor TFIID subunit 8 n=1 Tax=Kwoniella bestiolae CBS 10118 TaxID=1296100 RepID=A0A1B9G634_9TREE|nr:hypothetical protein I302_04181 [Kwoniella bestiolae CBS 10118]OCF26495.1 hypothetical protein I302_04181 [Kwoniella bestiolae CBS 10118]
MSTMRSLPSNSSSNYLPPNIPQTYIRQTIVDLLLKRGFEGAEAGALTEIERLLEHHITNLFQESLEFAHLSGRREVNALDLVSAQEESGWGVRRMKRESKRRRGKENASEVTYDPSLSTPPSPSLPSLSSLLDEQQDQAEDIKPDLSKARGVKPSYSQEWFPSLPEKWTLISPTDDNIPTSTDDSTPPNQPMQVTSALLDFIKLTATERGDIPPELGVVNYHRTSHRQDTSPDYDGGNRLGIGKGGGGGVKRKWGVKGVSARS